MSGGDSTRELAEASPELPVSLAAGLIVATLAGLAWLAIDALLIPGPTRPAGLVMLAWVAFAPAIARLTHSDRPWSSPASAGKTLALVLYGALPFLALPFVMTGLAGDCAALFNQPDQAYYYANGRAIFERGTGLLGPNAYDPSPDAPAIYGQWLLWLLGFLIAKLGIPTTTVHLLLLLVGGLAVGALTLALVRAVAEPSRDSGALPSLAFLAAMFGGGVFTLAGLLFAPQHDPIALDPAGGWWILQWGRILTLPIEAAYHAIVLAAWLAFRADRPIRGALLIALVAATHPFTGAEHLAATGLALTVLLARSRRRDHLIAWLLTAAASLAFAAYYFLWLPAFPEHRALEQLWRDHDYTISLTASGLAYALVLLPILTSLRPFSSFSSTPDSAGEATPGDPEGFRVLMMTTAAVVFLLSHHEWFMAPRQPAHFCRGYVWLPLFLLGLPPLLRRITALRARLRPRSLALVLSLGMVLVSLDNIAWLGHQAEQPPPRLVRLTPAMETVIARLSELHEDRGGPDVVLSTSHTLLNFVPVLSPLKAFYGHVQCTPDFGARVQQARAFLRDGAELDPTVQWFVVEAPLLDRLPRLRAAFEPVETLAGYTILRRRRAPAGARER